jgi:apolipoprotein D and lipocalin family protein
MQRPGFFLAVTLLAFGVAPSQQTNIAQEPLTTGCSDFKKYVDSTVQLDIHQYDGLWYEQIRTKHLPFEDACFCSEANYTIADDRSLKVENTCRQGTPTSPVTGSTGRAIIPDEKHPGYLLISFGLPFLRGSYAVIDTDYTSYSIIASCPRLGIGRWHTWILTREQQPEKELIEGLKNKTVSMGFSAEEFVTTYQGSDCNKAPEGDYQPIDTWDDYF